ncbi:hypothetical protein J437_LFUL000058 [Ladona fulva]|uniref:FAT domain-containing protein n=1 Tax=Ladona fulva TaxID=123851 RepID=A0A8K0NZ17_LADFU|nr:hypothetical protein J437_LFUL000058 [Ladona fulva]
MAPPPPTSSGGNDPLTQMNTYRSYVTMLADPGAKDEIKLKAAQELSENFEIIMGSSQYPAFLEHSMRIFLKILQDGEPHFIAEYNIQQVRKLILEMIHRLPTNEHLRPFVKQILSLMLHLLETENEENVLVCLHIIIELHKQYRPTFNPDILHFLQFVKCIYRELPNHLNKIFEPRPPIRVKDLSEINIEALLAETFTITAIQSEKKTPDGTAISYNLIPKAVLSLKVLQELPILVVLMYQLYKQNIHQDFADFIPLVMTTITLQPAQHHRVNPAFNREVFVDFMGAQIKTLSFLAYIIRVYQEVVSQHSSLMVKGMLGLLTLCPMEVAHLRKELLIAARHILATDLRIKFVPYMERLFDERVLLGRGWTTHESLRPLAYSTLADLVHHVRQHLPLTDLARAVHLFSKNVHDESLPTSIQTMSCKLLLNLVDCIRQCSEAEVAGQCRELLMRMLEVFVLKFKTIAKLQLPVLMNKFQQHQGVSTSPNSTSSAPASTAATTSTTTTAATAAANNEDAQSTVDGVPATSGLSSSSVQTLNSLIREEKDKSRFGFPASQSANYSVTDCRSLVKTLVCGVKTITWGCSSCKVVAADGSTLIQNKHFQPKETLVFVRLVRWALQALDVYTITPPSPVIGPLGNVTGAFAPQAAQPPRPLSIQQVRSKEEKEVLEHFAGVFALMNPQTFQEIFSTTIEYMVERIYHNYSLQIIGNSFLASRLTSPVFATVLVRYLLERMEEMGQGNAERSNLYLKLFKLVFGSVSLFPAENEQMLRPHLHQIVNRSMELAMTAKEPYNYFLLLRALFRSIGGGSHDLLYQEFLPLLPNLLQGLNSLQSGLHKQHMKDLFVELCLTVPVRLSSLLPYLPMLMDPLVSALNGSHTLISQGLRTLELCVDNLQPDFLYEHIQPVRADLMQALWRTLRNPTDQVAHVAFRVLGKFGGGNRKMMIEPQKLEYNERETSGPAIVAHFQDHKTPIAFPVEKFLRDFLENTVAASYTVEWKRAAFFRFVEAFQHDHSQSPAPTEASTNGMFVAAAIKEVSQIVLPTMVSLVRHYTLVAISQQAGPFPVSTRQSKLTGMDPLVLIDSLAVIMGHEEKELCKPGNAALILILETATSVLGSRERACRLPLMEYLAESMCSLCYDRAWYAKLGGCIAIKFLFERMATQWVFEHLYLFLKALLFVMMDLTGEVSSGAIDMAKANLERMLTVCAAPLPEGSSPELEGAQKKSLHDVTHELVRQVTSPNTLAREQAMHSLEVIAKIQGRSVTEVMEPHKDVLADMIPPRKHLLRHQPANAQIGLMDGNTFCTTLQPRLFTIDLNIEEHTNFCQELMSLCEMEDSALLKLPCYKSLAATGGGSAMANKIVGSAVIGGVPGSGGVSGVSGINNSGSNPLIPLRRSALRALAACHYVVPWRERIFHVLYRALERPHPELREAAFECMKRFIAGFQIEMEMASVHTVMRPLLLTLADYRYFNLSGAKHLSYLTQLFPTTFNEKLCEHLLQHLKKLLDAAIVAFRNGTRSGDNEERIATIIGIFHQIPAASARLLEMLCRIVLQAERGLLVEAGSPFRAPLLKFLLRYPSETIDVFLQENNIKDQQWSRFFEFLIKHKDGKPFRDVLQNSSVKLMNMALGLQYQTANLVPVRMEDGNTMLTHWTKKIIVEEGHTMGQLFHILQLVVRHYKVYYPVRHHLVQHMVASIQRLGFSPTASLEHRKLAVELAEVIIKWELQRIKDETTTSVASASPAEASPIPATSYHQDNSVGSPSMVTTGVKRPSIEEPGEGPPRKRHTSGQAVSSQGTSGISQGTQAAGGSGTGLQTVPQQKVDGSTRPIERAHADAVLNFLFRLACMVNDQSATVGSPGEMLSRRCVALLKAALKPDVWPAPQCDLKLAWLDKLFAGVESASGSGGGGTGVGMAGMSGGFGPLGGSQPNYANICTALDLLTFLVTVLRKEQILVTFRPLQRGISACMTCPNLKVIKLVHGLLTRLMSIFPTEVTSSPVASRYEDLECLYASVNKVVLEGLSSYEKSPSGGNAPGSSSASSTQGGAGSGMGVGGSQGGVGSLGVGGSVNAPTSLFGTLMVLKAACAHNPCYIDRLITSFMRVLQRMTKEHLSLGGADSSLANELLVLSLDLVKNRVGVMGVEMRKAFIGNILVGLIEKTPDVKVMKTIIKMLEEWMKNKNPIAVNQGPSLREKSILLVKLMQYVEKRFPDDLELNAQFLEIVNFVYRDESLKTTELTSKLEPAFLAGLRCVQPSIRAKFFEVFDGSMRRRLHDRLLYIVCSQNWESMGAHFWIKQCIELILVTCVPTYQIQISSANNMLPAVCSVINFADSNEKAKFVYATLQEEPVDPPLEANDSAEKVDLENMELSTVVDGTQGSSSSTPGLVSTPRKSSNGSVDLTGVSTGGPGLQQVVVRHAKFIESSREVRSSQLLIAAAQLCHMDSALAEQVWIAILPRIWRILSEKQQAEIYDSLSDLYTLLSEEDMWAGLWQRSWGGSNGPPRYRETAVALAYEQQGFFERAQNAYENVMAKARQAQEQGNANSVMGLHSEYALWEKHWIRCSKELNQWELLLEYGNMKGCNNPFLVLESAWRIPNWPLMKEALSLVELSCPKEMAWKVNLYRGFLAICHPEEQNLGTVKRHVEAASGFCMREWRRLPRVVSHAHLPLLQAAQQIMELQEALQIHQGLLHSGNSSLHDMKAIVKTWRNRLPVIADDLSHWSDIFTWRQHHYQFIASHYDSHQGDAATNHSMLGVHASAQAIIHFGKVARKHNLTGVCLDSLSRIYTIPSVPIVDCFQKIRQQVKCYLQMAQVTGKNELQEGLEVIESTNLRYFTKEMTAEFYALKGMLLAQIGRSDDANKAFSSAVQMHDTLVKAWALWGDYLEGIFTRDSRQLNLGVSAITCFLHACRHQNESKSRKYLAKVLWLLTYEDKDCVLTQAVDKWSVGVPPAAWLPWVPQLLTCLVRAEGRLVLNLLSSVGRVFPQAVYFPIRTLYLTLKIEQRERYKSAELAAQVAASAAAAVSVTPTTTTAAPVTPVKVSWNSNHII